MSLSFLEQTAIALYTTPGYKPRQSCEEAQLIADAFCETYGHTADFGMSPEHLCQRCMKTERMLKMERDALRNAAVELGGYVGYLPQASEHT